MASRPQIVYKEINGKTTPVKEFFITDLVEYLLDAFWLKMSMKLWVSTIILHF